MSQIERLGFAFVAIILWFVSQRFLGKRVSSSDSEIRDHLHLLTAKVNTHLYTNTNLANFFIISSSLIIDVLTAGMLIWSILGPSVKPLVCLFILFFLRQLNQTITQLPTPKNMIWRYPGYPSIFVTYKVSNDLFFSGHTALATLAALELISFGNIFLSALALLILVYEIVVVLILRAHWTMDVFTGAVTAMLVYEFVSHLGI